MTRAGDWMTTYTGRQVWPLDPVREEIHLEDIAHALSNQCRFAGHCRVFYSVAEHSVRVARLCLERQALWSHEKRQNLGKAALLHDASEAYLMDIPRPLKRTTVFEEYRNVERRLMRAIDERFDVTRHDGVTGHVVDLADAVLLRTELRDLMPPMPAAAGTGQVIQGTEVIEDEIIPWPRHLVRQTFLGMAKDLGLE